MRVNKRASIPYSSSVSGANRSERLVRGRQHVRCQVDSRALEARRSTAYSVHLGVTLASRKSKLCYPVGGRLSRVKHPPVAHEATQRAVGTHIKVVVAPHLDGELFSNPGPHLRPF